MTMTPQLQQAVRLLQMSAFDLVAEIQQQIESNPMLEEIDSATQPSDPVTDPSGVDRDDVVVNDERTAADVISADEGLRSDEVSGDKLLDTDFDALYDPPVTNTSSTMESSFEFGGFDQIDRGESPTSLRQHLVEQLTVQTMSVRDRTIAFHIIDAIDDRGYLVTTVADIAELISTQLHEQTKNKTAEPMDAETSNETTIEVSEVEAVLKILQNFDPDGVCARDLRECLLIQLRHKRHGCEVTDLAHQLVETSLDTVAARNFKRLQREHKASQEQLEQAVQIITALSPHPGDSIGQKDAEFIVPDLFVRKHKGEWRVQLNSQNIPRLQLNRHYLNLSEAGRKKTEQKPDKDTTNYLKQNLTEANWFLKALHNRHDTLLRVGTEIVSRQDAFFEDGEAAMIPMVLADVASALDLHESTISRATAHKYMQTPYGVFELKFFFSSALTGSDGEAHSSTAIRSLIKQIVLDEPPTKPISDNKISNLLLDRGISVARRTVAKYRESMNIPSSSDRKRLS